MPRNMDVRADFVLYTLTIVFAFVGGDWSANCPSSCKCIWSDGKKTAECQDAGFSAVPSTLSPELQILNLNHNNLHSLPSQAFKSVNIFHLHKIFLRNCSIELVDKSALSGMVVLIEIDLSSNNIRILHKDLFRECEKIREVRLANNPIQKLEDGLFSNLEFLQTVDLSGCKLHEIGSQAFWNVPALTTLELKGNKFTNLPLSSVEHLHKLKNFGLTDNPWNCNCKLRPLRNWVVKRNLYAVPTGCKEPPHMKDVLWIDVNDPDEFSCKPNIVSLTREPHGILACLVEGDPLPTVTWTFNNKLVTNHSFLASDFIVQESSFGGFKWSNLTLRNSRGRDNGEYKCIAKSFGGEQELGKEVRFDSYIDGDSYYGSSDSSYDNWLLLAGSIIGALLLIVIVLFVKFYVCRRRNSGNRNKKEKENANGSVTHVIDSEEKNLINVINPLQKPPRRTDASVNSSETEFQDSNLSQFNENGSVKGSIALENKEQSIGSVATLPRSRIGDDNNDSSTDRCPPDLLSFPSKHNQGSPDSGTPFGMTADRSPYSRPQKLLNSPQYAGQFGTLPYSRSHSPFSPPLTVVPRQSGYVTIPRRPRVPSWSSPLSPVFHDSGESLKAEPIYDNLGPRTTADGSSVISLNKSDANIPVTYKNRPLPQTPSDTKRYYEPINENGTFAPILRNSRTPSTIHRSNPAVDKTQRDLSTPDNKRQSWARITPEGAQIQSTEETESLITPDAINPRVVANRKIPPNPPPKPKKKPGKTFYEDEGEDGTEV